jgi:uncharacterized membrane protein
MSWLLSLMPVALVAGLLHWLPLWRARSLWFGVTVSPDFSQTPEARTALRQYRLETWASSAVAAGLTGWGVQQARPWLMEVGLVLQFVGASAAFALARERVRAHAARVTPVRVAALFASSEGLPGGVFGALGPFALLGAIALFLHANWNRIPDRFPIHWGLSGAPDRWAERTWPSVYGSLLMGAVLIGVLLLLGQVLLHGSPRAREGDTTAWATRFRRANLRALIAVCWGMSAMLSFLALAPVLVKQAQVRMYVWVAVVALLVLLLPFIWQIVQIGRAAVGSDGTPDDCWKLGQFYYNPHDPALMVPKRFGVGYTFNLGNRGAWLILGALGLVVWAALAVQR